MTVLTSKLGLVHATGLSMSIIAPTAAMALNVSLAALAAGRAAPIAFAIGTVVMAIVGASFIAFSRRIAHAGSVYAYVSHAFGHRCGFIAGWTLLLTYLTYAGGASALVGSLLQTAAQNFGLDVAPLWLVFGIGAILAATYCAYLDMRIAAALILALEGLSVLAIFALSCISSPESPGPRGCRWHPSSLRRNSREGRVSVALWSSPSFLSPDLRAQRRSVKR